MKKNANKGPKTPVSAPSKPTPASSKSATASAAPAKTTKKASATAAPAAKQKAPKTTTPVVQATPAVVQPKALPASPDVIPAVKTPAAESPSLTTIVARIDVGFGNNVTIRGEGAGLNWDKGIVMENVAADRWQIVLPGVKTPVVFKFLLNDETWSAGEDYVITPGSSLVLEPLF